MNSDMQAKIFLADDRGVTENDWFRSLHTFNFGHYSKDHKQPFGPLCLLNDDVLDARRSLQMSIEEDMYVILLPVMGALAYSLSTGEQQLVAAGQVAIIETKKGDLVKISNPFDEGLINFLQLWLRSKQVLVNRTAVIDYTTGLARSKWWSFDSPVVNEMPFRLSIANLGGREDAPYLPHSAESLIFLWVIDGAFEAEGRLMHARDGLALWNCSSIDVESLSQQGWILALEMRGD